MPVRVPAVVQPGDRLLADVAALGEGDRLLDDPGLGREHGRVDLGAEARDAGLDAGDLVGLGADRARAGRDQLAPERRHVARRAEHVDTERTLRWRAVPGGSASGPSTLIDASRSRSSAISARAASR